MLSRRLKKTNMSMSRLVFAACIISMAAIALAATPVTYIFGDSLTDVGNNNFLQYSLAKSNYPWYGIDYSGGQATGRFCNGRTIGDFICIFCNSTFSCFCCFHVVYGLMVLFMAFCSCKTWNSITTTLSIGDSKC